MGLNVGLDKDFTNKYCKIKRLRLVGGGDAGIRTLGTREGSTVFETAPFDHSGTSPHLMAVV